jgi:hypothetical protein
MEWWAMAPESVHPSPATIQKAGQWLVKTIKGLSESEVKRYYTFLSHAGRSLALWRGKLPAEVIAQAPPILRGSNEEPNSKTPEPAKKPDPIETNKK